MLVLWCWCAFVFKLIFKSLFQLSLPPPPPPPPKKNRLRRLPPRLPPKTTKKKSHRHTNTKSTKPSSNNECSLYACLEPSCPSFEGEFDLESEGEGGEGGMCGDVEGYFLVFFLVLINCIQNKMKFVMDCLSFLSPFPISFPCTKIKNQ